MQNRFTYPGAPAEFTGAEDTANINPGSTAARKDFRKRYAPKTLEKAPETAPRSEPKPLLTVKQQLLLVPVVVVLVVILAIGWSEMKQAIFRSAPAQEISVVDGEPTEQDARPSLGIA